MIKQRSIVALEPFPLIPPPFIELPCVIVNPESTHVSSSTPVKVMTESLPSPSMIVVLTISLSAGLIDRRIMFLPLSTIVS